MKLRSAILAITAIFILLPATATANPPQSSSESEVEPGPGSDTMVIQRAAPSGWFGPFDEFVEFRNISGSTLDLAWWNVWACTNATSPEIIHTFLPGQPGTVIGPDEYIVFAGPLHFSPDVDYVYTIDVPNDGGWAITDHDGEWDSVGFGQAGAICIEALPALPCNWSRGDYASRDEYGTDTDINTIDFGCG